MKKNFLLVVLAAVVLAACNRNRPSLDGVLNNEEPVDLSDVVEAYEKWLPHEGGYGGYVGGFLPIEVVEWGEKDVSSELFGDTSFVVRVPEYRNSQHPFLRGAEDLYNGCALAFNLMSNVQTAKRWSFEKKNAVESIKKIDVGFINNKGLRTEAKRYKNNLIQFMQLSEDELMENWVNYMDYLVFFSDEMEKYTYKYYTNEGAFVDSLDIMLKAVYELSATPFMEYLRAEKDNRVMLRNLNQCKSFDEQCSLLLNWAQVDESEWLIAVAERLMRSGKYSPVLYKVWLTWRFVGQVCLGSPHDSGTPNPLYNEMRKRCFLTCLKQIETHPDDVFAVHGAAVLAGKANVFCFNLIYFGYDAAADLQELVPGRFTGDDGMDDEEEEGTDNGE